MVLYQMITRMEVGIAIGEGAGVEEEAVAASVVVEGVATMIPRLIFSKMEDTSKMHLTKAVVCFLSSFPSLQLFLFLCIYMCESETNISEFFFLRWLRCLWFICTLVNCNDVTFKNSSTCFLFSGQTEKIGPTNYKLILLVELNLRAFMSKLLLFAFCRPRPWPGRISWKGSWLQIQWTDPGSCLRQSMDDLSEVCLIWFEVILHFISHGSGTVGIF